MNQGKLLNIFNYLDGGGEIVVFNYDFFRKSLNVVINVLDNSVEQVYNITFKNISSFYINNGPGDSRLDYELVSDVEFWELSSIGFIKEGIGLQRISSSNSLFDDYYSNSTFFLEIYNTLILIESHSLEINEEQYTIP
ncbi:hypothetical protein SAMN04489762_1866 [Terribacillus saccharophilus]|uniref:Uncharacterized protein n=1 Tax=Terribacillus saccharophilus TaxID=361277 RepID=A0AAX2EFC7_9BACI|nr:hypothetical protein SAMN04489762_1866 [Terribacillus saccharophilus]